MPKLSTADTRKPGVSKTLKKKSGNKVKRIPRSKKKPEWDSTSNDLNVYKLSKQEVEQRHRVHQSKNIEAAKHELYDKAKESYDVNSSGNLRPSPQVSAGSSARSSARKTTAEAKKLLALQQSLHGRELHSVLLKSDHTMRVVKDLFGDDPKRYSCQPNVTVAPHMRESKQILEQAISESLHDGPPPTAHASPGGIRDKAVREIVLRKPALNDLPSEIDYDVGEESRSGHAPLPTQPCPDQEHPSKSPTTIMQCLEEPSFKPALNLGRFQKLLEQEREGSGTLSHPQRPTTSRGVTEGWGEGAVMEVGQRGSEASDSISITDVSELSSIPVHPDLAALQGNVTVDSEASSIPMHPDFQVRSDLSPAQDNVTVDSETSSGHAHPQSRQGAVWGHRGGGVSNSHPLLLHHPQPPWQAMHPLHHSHKMANQLRPPPHGGRGNKDETLPCSKKTSMIHTDLAMLEKLVRDLDQELTAYEAVESTTAAPLTSDPSGHTSHPPSGPSDVSEAGRHGGGEVGWAGVMGSLVGVVRKLMGHLRQSEVQLKGEVAVRAQFLQTLHEQQDLMDVLTADLLQLRKENMTLKQDFAAARKATAREIADVKASVSDVHSVVAKLAPSHFTIPSSQPATSVAPPTSRASEAPPTPGSVGSSQEQAHCKVESPGRALTPDLSLDHTLVSSMNGKVSLDDTGGTLRGEQSSTGSEAGREKPQGVIYAQASPLSYNARSRTYMQATTSDPHHVSSGPIPMASDPSLGKVHVTSAPPVPSGPVPTAASVLSASDTSIGRTTRSAFSKPRPANSHHSGDFLQSLDAPAPPPLNVALQVPSYPPPGLAPPLSVLAAPPSPSLTPQASVPRSQNLPHPSIIAASTQQPVVTVPTAQSGADLVGVVSNTTAQTDTKSEPTIPDFQKGVATGSGDTRGERSGAGMFDVTRLLDSLQQLSRTQDHLQATADKLRSLPQDGEGGSILSQSSADDGGEGMSRDASGPASKKSVRLTDHPHRQLETADLSLSYVSSLPGEVSEVSEPDSELHLKDEAGEVSKTSQMDTHHSSPAVVKRKVAFAKDDSRNGPLQVATNKGLSVVLHVEPADRGKSKVEGRPPHEQRTWFALSSHLT